MKPVFTLFLFLIVLNSCTVNNNQKEKLANELTQILDSDQELRELFTPELTAKRKSQIFEKHQITEAEFQNQSWKLTEKNDSLNLIKVEKIIRRFGYPGKKLVGNDLSTAVWYVIQHSKLPVMEKYYPLIKNASEEGELSKKYVAMMQDRILMYQGKEQIYGTQGAGRLFINPETKQEEWTNFLWPIEDFETVNERRKSVGINVSIEEYIISLGPAFSQTFTLEEIEKRTKK